ncbi:MAG: DUF1552 domain-containing protein [Gemmataceae bacterium]
MNPTRRSFLRAGGVCLALPWLEAFAPATPAAAATPRRLVCVCTPLGLHAPNFFPAVAGRGYAPTPYLDILRDFRDDFTVISGLFHPGIENGHDSIFSFLTAAPHPERRAGFRNTISFDQVAADHIGERTRFPSLQLSHEGFGLSWTRTGALIPPNTSPAGVFTRLFLGGRPEQVREQVRRLRDNRSILDAVGAQAGALKTGLGAGDRGKLDEYFTSVRELERRMANAEEWSARPLPRVDAVVPRDIPNPADLVGKTRLLLDLTHLALQTDSTRLVTILLGGTSLVPPIAGVSLDHHNLSHHGLDADKLAQLSRVESETMRTLRDFLARLKATREDGDTLLDRTSVFFGSNLGSGNSHSCRNLPVLVAGGGFRHGQHLAFNPTTPPPLANLFVSLLERLGVDTDRFGSSTGTLTGL